MPLLFTTHARVSSELDTEIRALWRKVDSLESAVTQIESPGGGVTPEPPEPPVIGLGALHVFFLKVDIQPIIVDNEINYEFPIAINLGTGYMILRAGITVLSGPAAGIADHTWAMKASVPTKHWSAPNAPLFTPTFYRWTYKPMGQHHLVNVPPSSTEFPGVFPATLKDYAYYPIAPSAPDALKITLTVSSASGNPITHCYKALVWGEYMTFDPVLWGPACPSS